MSTLENETKLYINAVRAALKRNFGVIEEQWEGRISMLETYFDIWMKAKKRLKSEGVFLQKKDGSLYPNPAISLMKQLETPLSNSMRALRVNPDSLKTNITAEPDEEDLIEAIKDLGQ